MPQCAGGCGRRVGFLSSLLLGDYCNNCSYLRAQQVQAATAQQQQQQQPQQPQQQQQWYTPKATPSHRAYQTQVPLDGLAQYYQSMSRSIDNPEIDPYAHRHAFERLTEHYCRVPRQQYQYQRDPLMDYRSNPLSTSQQCQHSTSNTDSATSYTTGSRAAFNERVTEQAINRSDESGFNQYRLDAMLE